MRSRRAPPVPSLAAGASARGAVTRARARRRRRAGRGAARNDSASGELRLQRAERLDQGIIQKVESLVAGPARQRFVESSDGLGRELEEGLRASRYAQVDEACQGLEEVLESLPGVGTPDAARILALARAAGSTGKVSGAGGGDGCVLFSPDEDARRALLAALGHRGFVAVPLSIEPGVRAESGVPPELRAWLDARKS